MIRAGGDEGRVLACEGRGESKVDGKGIGDERAHIC